MSETPSETPKTPEIYKCCDNPQITYLAPVNINVDEKTIGTVDVWRCAVCKKSFCEEKQLGIESISDIVGFTSFTDKADPAEVQAVLEEYFANMAAIVFENKGIGAFVVPTDIDGLTIGPPEKKMGWKASDTRQLFFENMSVPKANMIAEPAEGFKTFLTTLTGGRISVAALAVGTAEVAYDRALRYSKERSAFGKKIHQFQPVGFKLADMATQIEAAKLLTFHAAWKKDQGLNFIKEAAMAKLFASEVAMKTTTDAIQVHGGYGYVKDYDVERYFRDAKILEIGEGTSEIQRLIISREILKTIEDVV